MPANTDTDIHRRILDEIQDGVYFLDTDRRITYWNRGAERITGFKSDEVLGRCCSDNILMHVDHSGLQLCKGHCPAARTIADGSFQEDEVFLHHKQGHRVPVRVRTSPVRDEAGGIIGAVEIFNDNSQMEVTRQRIRELEKQALLDHLTGLPNRRYVEDRMVSSFAEFQRYGMSFGILILDLDRFKRVNDKHGHDRGDKLLRLVGKTLLHNCRPFDIIGRWGGEEFLGVVRNVDGEGLHCVAERYRALIQASKLPPEDDNLNITVSIGCTLNRKDDTTESLVIRADEALYVSKDGGRNMVTLA